MLYLLFPLFLGFSHWWGMSVYWFLLRILVGGINLYCYHGSLKVVYVDGGRFFVILWWMIKLLFIRRLLAMMVFILSPSAPVVVVHDIMGWMNCRLDIGNCSPWDGNPRKRTRRWTSVAKICSWNSLLQLPFFLLSSEIFHLSDFLDLLFISFPL